MGTLLIEMGEISQLGKVLCTHCLKSLMDYLICMIICIIFLRIYQLKMESDNWTKYLTTCNSRNYLIPKWTRISKKTTQWAHLPLKKGNLNQFDKLLCTYCLNSWTDFYSILIFLSLCHEYINLKVESVNWKKYLTTCKSCTFNIQKLNCITIITN